MHFDELKTWVQSCAELTRPDRIHWCDGSEAEYERLLKQMTDDGSLIPLNQQSHPGCYLHRSNPNDVARVEHLTYICAEREEDAGPFNHWLSPSDAKARMTQLFEGCMQGRTLYVVPYVMGPIGSPMSKVGVELTDSPYVVANMRIMTRMGQAALDQLAQGGEFVPGLHSIGELDPERRMICHFPEERLILSYGSGYGGNALLGKKCFALRIASAMARSEGWLAEHMLILELTDPEGEKTYIAAAFPSACGKTNLAMLVSPLESEGYSVRTVGDDIAWMRVGEDGRLWAINPEAGFFGVAPGTSLKTNPNAMRTMERNTIFTNVALTGEGSPWWEGIGEEPGDNLTDWLGNRPWTGEKPAAHANSRFTAPAGQCPCISPHWEDPQGVPISAILFGGRRPDTMPLVMEAFNWQHGVFLGATMASQTTAAAAGEVGALRYDPMAMLPFCGYHMGDYLQHWLGMGKRIPRPPRIFHVNWFRQDADGAYLWPGYGDNVRALIWILDRLKGRAKGQETAVGVTPQCNELNLSGLGIGMERLKQAIQVLVEEWQDDPPQIRSHFHRFGTRLPAEMWLELKALEARLGQS